MIDLGVEMMKIGLHTTLDEQVPVAIFGLFEEDKSLDTLHPLFAVDVKMAMKEKRFKSDFGETYHSKFAGSDYRMFLLVGLGKREEMTLERVRRLMGKCIKLTKSQRFSSFTTNIIEQVAGLERFEDELLGCAAAEGLLLADYLFIHYLSPERQQKVKPVEKVSFLWAGSRTAFGDGLKKGRTVAEATNFVRDLVNEPANVVNATYLEKTAKNLGNHAITVRVLEKKELEELGMGALLGVNAGSKNPPKLILLEYFGKHTGSFDAAFVGKGITFDSGGYNLKPTKFIEEMHTDMAGAAAVLGVIKAAAAFGVKKNLLGVLPICENMVSGEAQRPGDIVRAYNGKTIQIGNTDAEGRLILADAIAYVEDKYHPKIIVDLATLTGACVVALGYYAAGVVGNDENLLVELKEAGEKSGDRVWPLPFYDDYKDWMDGSVTDLNNISTKGKGYEAGSITAGVFLSKFVKESKWAHLDIAGSAFWAVEGDYVQKGATGSGVRVLLYWLMKGN
ncbi:leucyl aminopeptidase [Candidatus Woesearchaeota archaeon]|nr:leucyl aminopeptidase [Candidatus Woesearchaeota archaeon]